MAASVTEEGRVALYRLDSAGEAAPRGLEPAVENPFEVKWSPSGDVLLVAGARAVQVWRVEENGTAELLRETPVEAEDAAVSDGGALVLARSGGVLSLLGGEGSMQEVSREAQAFAFLGADRFAWIEGRLLHLGSGAGSLAAAELEELPEGGARLLAAAGRGRLLLVESAPGESRLRLWNGSGEMEGEWRCPAEIEALRTTGVAGVLHLAPRGGGPAWMADLGALQPSVFFIPENKKPERHGGEEQ